MDESVMGAIVIGVVALAAGALAVLRLVRKLHAQRPAVLEEMGRRLDELTLQVVELKLALSHYQVGVATLSAQLVRVGAYPDWRPNVLAERATDEEPLVRIYHLISENFSLMEMDALAALAGIPPESYSGNERPARALSLVQYAARHGHLQKLVSAGRKERPSVRWPVITIERSERT